MASFKPADLPAVLTYPANAETVRDAAAALEEGLVSDGFSHLVRGYVEQQRAAAAETGTLHLNAACPLIQRLVSQKMAPARSKPSWPSWPTSPACSVAGCSTRLRQRRTLAPGNDPFRNWCSREQWLG